VPGVSAIIVLTNAPDRAVARRIADALIERKLAACVNILGECTSVYRWKGAIETATEVPILIKTRADIYDDVEAAIRGLHPYELPEIIAVAVERGSTEFLDWVNEQTVTEIG
jgi:periplasmic divalent cation tolerance protein